MFRGIKLIDFKPILKDIEPSQDDKNKVHELSNKLMELINSIAENGSINAEAVLLGSVAKNTWIASEDNTKNPDIDIFIKFPLSTSLEDLKNHGLELARKCIEISGGVFEERYASHPYLTGIIKGFEVDLVPCYDIKDASQLKSAVDRTILHTEYVVSNLEKDQEREVRLLKRFMQMVGTYGSEFKVGGFSGYLCELLVIHYGSFLDVLKGAWAEWKPCHHIDLKKYGTSRLFKDPLIVIDPTDENRNVSAALTLQKMSEFTIAAGNFLKNPDKSYFYPKQIEYNPENILEEFSSRETTTLILSFPTPDIPSDALHPQIRKTEASLVNIMECEDFSVMGSDSWTNADSLGNNSWTSKDSLGNNSKHNADILVKNSEHKAAIGSSSKSPQDSIHANVDLNDFNTKKAVILLEMNTWSLPILKKQNGPVVWDKENSEKFKIKHSHCWVEGDQWKTLSKRKYQDVDALIHGILKKDGINRLRVGKHLKKEILKNYDLTDVMSVLRTDNGLDEKLLKFLYHYLHKDEFLSR